MTSKSRKWESLKAEYLRKVEKALSSVKHPRGKEVLEDVRSHLDRRFAELEPQEQTWENIRTILSEMGPASDYAELLDAHAGSPGWAVRPKHLAWVGLAAVVIIAAILLPVARPDKTAGYVVVFKPTGEFRPVTARELLGAFNENHPGGVRTHHFRTQVKDNSLTGYICVDTEAAKDAVVSMLEKGEKLKLIKATAASDKELEELYKLGQPSIGSAATKDYLALPESPNRKLLDRQTLNKLRSHEHFSAGWFKVEEAYQAASDSERERMVQQWMTDATSDGFERATRAIAALGNVAVGQALDVLISIGQKPKNGNRPRWMAVRALGRIGDKKAVPLLVNLLDHYNSDTRLYAKVALCEITGVYFGDSIQEWTRWAQTNGIQIEQMDVGPKVGDSNQTRRTPRSRRRPPESRNQTVRRIGSWPDGDCSISGRVYRKALYSSIGHGKVCLSSDEFGSWIVEVQDNAQFAFNYIPAGTYTLRAVETLGYQDAFYNLEGKTVENPTFQLKEGEGTTANVEVTPVRPYHCIAGRILDEDGKPITNCEGLMVYAWWQKTQGRRKGQYERISSSSVNEDGGYLFKEMDARPVYVQVYDRDAPNKDNPYPPRFFPGTFSRSEAKLIASEDKETVENIDIPLQRTGGLVLEGLVTDESTGVPVPQALVSIFHRDMPFDLFCGYTNEQGRYRIEGLGEGTFIVHVDAVHKGFIKTRKIVTLKPDSEELHLNFTLRSGVTITGRFVDQNGNPWKVGRGFGGGRVSRRDSDGDGGSHFVYGNKYAPPYLREGFTIFYGDGEGDGLRAVMVYLTESSFLLPSLVPGQTTIYFSPAGRNESVLKILYRGNDILRTGLITEPGQKIDDVTIVVGPPGSDRPSRPQARTNTRTRTSRLHQPFARNQTVARSGPWPDGDCSLYGQVYRKAGNSGLGHGKVCLSSEELGSWTVEAQDYGQFEFRYIPAGIYTLRTLETVGYQDTFYNPENKSLEKPTFQLRQGQRMAAQIEVKPLRPYHSIAGRILDEDGKPIPDYKDFIVYAWVQKPQRQGKGNYLTFSSSLVNEDGGYLLEELDTRPVYVQAYDRVAQNKDKPYPPRFYPGTFSRADAKLVTSEDKELIENMDIRMKRTGGLVLEGLVTDDGTGAPVSEALVSIFHRDMPFDLFCGYTDQKGRYRIEGLGEGSFIVHVDAVHKGLVKTRKYVSMKPYLPKAEVDFALRPGATVSGRFVDDKGDPWKVGRALGNGHQKRGGFGDTTPNFVYGNKYAPSYIREGCTAFYQQGEGHSPGTRMVFPTESSFLLPALLPGETVIEFYPKRQGERLLQILYQGRDISRDGLVTGPGQRIDDVTIVIGTPGDSRPSRAQAGERLDFTLYDAFGREVRSQDYEGVPIFLEFGACW